MSFLKSSSGQAPNYMGLQLQTSVSTLPIPIVWGINKIAPNVLWDANFTAVGGTGKGGLAQNQKGTQYTVDIVMGLCEGPISNVGAIWRDQAAYTLASLDLSLYPGTTPQAAPSWLSAINGLTALGYQGTAWMGAPGYQLWGNSSVDAHQVEIVGVLAYTGANAVDADPSLVIWDFLTNSQYGAGFNPASIDIPSLFTQANVTASASFSTSQKTITVAAATASYAWIAAGMTVFDATTLETIGTVQSFNSSTNKITLTGNCAFASSGAADLLTLSTPGAPDSSLQSYCMANGICFSPALTSQEQASSILTRWLQILNCGAVWSEGQLTFVPYGDTSVAAGTQTTLATETMIPADGANIEVCSAAQFISDGGVVYAFNGEPFTYVPPGSDAQTACTATGQYTIAPGGLYVFYNQNATGDAGMAVVITFTYQTLAAFTPNLSVEYSLIDTDFVDPKNGKDPVEVSRVDPFSLATVQRVECVSRGNEYSLTPVTARDQSQIDIYGTHVGKVIEAHEVCDPAIAAPAIAQHILQRQLYVRSNYKFTLSWEYCLLDPMDIVEITDTNLGLSAYPVRITSIEEDSNGNLSIEAEELTIGIHTPALNPHASQYGMRINRAVSAGSIVTPPLIYEPPVAVTGGNAGDPQIWFGACSDAGGLPDPNWGGAYVWLSVDNITYTLNATIGQVLRQGVLTSTFGTPPSPPPGWDNYHTINVSFVQSGATLNGTSQAAAQRGATLCLIDNELLAYETATLTGPNAYALTGLQRGLFGTVPRVHPAGAAFYRLDDAVEKIALPQHLIGQTLYVKIQSFNVFRAGLQSLSACTAYTYTPAGTGARHPISAQLLTAVALDFGGLTSDAPVVGDDLGDVYGKAAVTIVDLGVISYHPIAQQAIAALPSGTLDLGAVAGANSTPTIFDDFGLVAGDAVVDAINLGTAP